MSCNMHKNIKQKRIRSILQSKQINSCVWQAIIWHIEMYTMITWQFNAIISHMMFKISKYDTKINDV